MREADAMTKRCPFMSAGGVATACLGSGCAVWVESEPKMEDVPGGEVVPASEANHMPKGGPWQYRDTPPDDPRGLAHRAHGRWVRQQPGPPCGMCGVAAAGVFA